MLDKYKLRKMRTIHLRKLRELKKKILLKYPDQRDILLQYIDLLETKLYNITVGDIYYEYIGVVKNLSKQYPEFKELLEEDKYE